jgi:hypothetical protein
VGRENTVEVNAKIRRRGDAKKKESKERRREREMGNKE